MSSANQNGTKVKHAGSYSQEEYHSRKAYDASFEINEINCKAPIPTGQ